MDLVSVLVTVLLAAGGWYLGWVMGKKQQRIALLPTRMEIHDATRRFLSRVLEAAIVERTWLLDLMRETRHADYLFGGEVRHHIDGLYKKGLDWVLLNDTHRLAEAAEMMEWFVKQVDETKRIFGKYLKVSEN